MESSSNDYNDYYFQRNLLSFQVTCDADFFNDISVDNNIDVSTTTQQQQGLMYYHFDDGWCCAPHSWCEFFHYLLYQMFCGIVFYWCLFTFVSDRIKLNLLQRIREEGVAIPATVVEKKVITSSSSLSYSKIFKNNNNTRERLQEKNNDNNNQTTTTTTNDNHNNGYISTTNELDGSSSISTLTSTTSSTSSSCCCCCSCFGPCRTINTAFATLCGYCSDWFSCCFSCCYFCIPMTTYYIRVEFDNTFGLERVSKIIKVSETFYNDEIPSVLPHNIIVFHIPEYPRSAMVMDPTIQEKYSSNRKAMVLLIIALGHFALMILSMVWYHQTYLDEANYNYYENNNQNNNNNNQNNNNDDIYNMNNDINNETETEIHEQAWDDGFKKMFHMHFMQLLLAGICWYYAAQLADRHENSILRDGQIVTSLTESSFGTATVVQDSTSFNNNNNNKRDNTSTTTLWQKFKGKPQRRASTTSSKNNNNNNNNNNSKRQSLINTTTTNSAPAPVPAPAASTTTVMTTAITTTAAATTTTTSTTTTTGTTNSNIGTDFVAMP